MNECDSTLDYGKSLVCKMQVWLYIHSKVEEQPAYECSLILQTHIIHNIPHQMLVAIVEITLYFLAYFGVTCCAP